MTRRDTAAGAAATREGYQHGSAAMLGLDQVTALRHYARATDASQALLAAQVQALLCAPLDPSSAGELPSTD